VRTVYLSTPAYLAEQAADWVRRGVRLVGGCCGTTPETIRAIRNGLAAMRRIPKVTTAAVRPAVSSISAPATEAAPASTTLRKPGGFLDALSTRLPIIAELDSPPHLDWRPMVAGAKALLDAGAQAISLAENPLASTRMDNFFVGGVIARETGKQVICHITCRDRNSLGLQSTLMGAHAAGIEAVLAITGDPAQRGGHQRVTSVYELNSLGLVRLVSNLNAGRSATGRDLRGATNFSIGVAFNSASVNFEAEVARLRRKQEAGAVFAMTQPVFSLDHAKRVLEKTRMDRLRVFLGFLPPITLKLARYLHHEVPGIQIPGELMSRLAALENPADQEKLAIEHTTNLIASLADELQGVYLITPGNRWSSLIPLIAHIDTIRMRG